jgi:sulfur relay protein TusD/DsrE
MTQQFTLFIHSDSTNAVYSAYQFASGLIAQNLRPAYIFFWRHSVFIANKNLGFAGDDLNVQQLWQQLSTQHNLPLHVCKAGAIRRSINQQTLAQCFVFGSVGTLSDHLTDYHQLISF